MRSFDLIVIGGGPAGESAALTAANLGKRVAIVEKDGFLGGASVNTGTVPSKTLRETALALSGLRSRGLHGVDLSLRRHATVADLLHHERAVKLALRSQIKSNLERHDVLCLHGTARLAGPNSVVITNPEGVEETLSGEKIFIAIGSFPLRPKEFPFDHERVHDSDELLHIGSIPNSIAIIGAGVIGSEYACMFATLGVKTYLVDGRNKLLPFLDHEISHALQASMESLGIEFVWNERVTECPDPKDGPICLTLASGRKLEVDQVLICAGRACHTPSLMPAAVNLEVAEKGRIPVDCNYRTNVPSIYAVGDVIGFPALASTSAEQGRLAAMHAFTSRDDLCPIVMMPTGIYTIPEISSVGDTEQSLLEKNIDHVVGYAGYAEVARGKIIGERNGFLKLIFARPTRSLLGVHVIGELATEIVHLGVMGMMYGATADFYVSCCFNYPTLGELYKLAATRAVVKLDK